MKKHEHGGNWQVPSPAKRGLYNTIDLTVLQFHYESCLVNKSKIFVYSCLPLLSYNEIVLIRILH